MTKETFYLTAGDGARIAVHTWVPGTKPSAVIQISHGMAEYAMRYDRFAEEAVKAGCAVFAADHRGHGETAGSLDKLGYLADTNGFERVVEDQYEITLDIKKKFPSTPVILFGHSFGSFIAQRYIQKHGEDISACILTGTAGPNPALVGGGALAANLVALFDGRKKPSPFLTKLSFGTYNKAFPDAKSPNSWLSRDAEEVDKYDASPWSGFTCTAGFFQDLMAGLSLIHTKGALSGLPLSLPVLLASGSADPVSGAGKTVKLLADLYRDIGIKNVKLVLYPGARHEILNETNRDEVTKDILDWIASVLAGISPSR